VATSARFAHQSEAEFARLLDFYRVEWRYEPCTFPIVWDASGKVLEWFSPDFYLPQYDLFLEMTVLSPRLQSRKNRKIRLFREAYPDIAIKLFTRRDVERVFSNRLAHAS
jgi:hypoxanthine phosphoribosyltransferase